jgi:DNA repair photolyase
MVTRKEVDMEKAVIRPLTYPCYPKGWQLDLMKGCDVGCIYCSLAGKEQIGPLDISDVLNSTERPEGIYLSPNSDPFSILSRDNTHRVLEKFLPQGVKTLLITKNNIPKRTIRLMSRYAKSVFFNITLCRLDPELNKLIEKNSATAEERLDTIKQLIGAGLSVSVRMTPLFPIVDDDLDLLDEFVGRVAKAGAFQVKVAYAVLRDALVFRPVIEKMCQHPLLKQAWNTMTDTIEIYKGKGNVPPIERRLQLYRDMFSLTQKHGIKLSICSLLDLPLLKMKDIDKGLPVCTHVQTNFEK